MTVKFPFSQSIISGNNSALRLIDGGFFIVQRIYSSFAGMYHRELSLHDAPTKIAGKFTLKIQIPIHLIPLSNCLDCSCVVVVCVQLLVVVVVVGLFVVVVVVSSSQQINFSFFIKILFERNYSKHNNNLILLCSVLLLFLLRCKSSIPSKYQEL